MNDKAEKRPEIVTVSVKDFFEAVPPEKKVLAPLADLTKRPHFSELQFPNIHIHCDNPGCNGMRFFNCVDGVDLTTYKFQSIFVTFRCKNCGSNHKKFAISIFEKSDGFLELFKYGEQPSFGPVTPSRVISLAGAEREYYLKGRRSENMGLGIAAFAYYRRVVEHQKNKIIDEIIRVAEKISPDPNLIEQLNAAKRENQFKSAVDKIKVGIPPPLLINGHNPLTLLHSALSEGLHAQSDEDCLELATSVRLVLTEFVERVASALKEEQQLLDAVSRLMNGKPKDNEK